MITKHVIDTIYRKYRRKPASPEQLDIAQLFDESLNPLNIEVDNREITIGSIDKRSPFHSIPLSRIHGIERFDSATAIVLHSSIIFLSRKGKGVNVHIKEPPRSIWQKIRWWFSR